MTRARDFDHLKPVDDACHPFDGREAAVVFADDGQDGQPCGAKTVT
jgi:hypothetical protein